MISVLNEIHCIDENGVTKVSVKCPVCGKVSCFSDKKKVITPTKCISFDLKCYGCQAILGSYSNIS